MAHLLIAFAFTTLVQGSTEYLARGTKLKFYFPSKQEVTFQWWIPHTTIEYYQWVGIALQDVRDPRDNFQCDYYMALTQPGGVMIDHWSNANGSPPTDISKGGRDDLITDRLTVDNYQVFVFTRKLQTGDEWDVTLEKGRPVLVKWAMSQLNQDGSFKQHTMDDMGFEYLVLTDDYYDRNHDQRGKYGPWMEEPAQKQESPEDRNQDMQEWSEDIESEYGRPEESSTGEYASDKDEPQEQEESGEEEMGVQTEEEEMEVQTEEEEMGVQTEEEETGVQTEEEEMEVQTEEEEMEVQTEEEEMEVQTEEEEMEVQTEEEEMEVQTEEEEMEVQTEEGDTATEEIETEEEDSSAV